MHPNWQIFLTDQGGSIEAGALVNFAEGDTGDNENTMTDISHLSLIEITGKDVTDFLNGQFTTNIKLLEKHRLQFSAWCNPKGQVRATFLIYQHESGFNVLLPKDLAESFTRKLQMYVLRSDVQITDNSETMVRIGLEINQTHLLGDAIESVPQQAGNITVEKDLHCLRTFPADSNGTSERYILIGALDKLKGLWQVFKENITAVGAQHWKLMEIQSGYPWLSIETTEKFLPQMLNMDLINGLDYQKGCYPGQEIIARLHYRGQLKRRLYLATCSLEAYPEIGEPIYADDTDKSIGTIVNAQTSQQAAYLLAITENESIQNNLFLRQPGGVRLTIKPLPYQDA